MNSSVPIHIFTPTLIKSARMKPGVARLILLFILPVFVSVKGFAQCGSSVPSYTIDLTGDPDSVWTSPSVSRDGYCCSASGTDRCIVFYVTLDSFAAGIRLDISGGTGSTFYQVGCSTTVATGTSTCITATGQLQITVCKPGGNAQQYTITSIPGGYASASSVYVSKNCTTSLAIQEVFDSTITWTALDTSYNYALSCTAGCDTMVLTADTSFPSYLDVRVCGVPVNPCAGSYFCDTLRIYYLHDLTVSLSPEAAYLCTGVSTTNIKAIVTGGQRPYSYSWTGTSDTDSSIDVGAGTYIVTVTDAVLCPVARDTVTVTAASLPAPSIGGNTTVCEDMSYTYSVTSVSGHSYSWNATNGTIIGSSTSNSVSIRWDSVGSGSTTVTQTNDTTGCIGTDDHSVNISAKPGTAPIQH